MARADAALRTVIETLYERFDCYGCPKRMHAAPTRDIDAIMSALTSAPLRELSSEALDGYSTWAMTTVGDPEDYMHFLPRIFELALTEKSWNGLEPEIIAYKINYAGWQSWDGKLRQAVEDAFRLAWAWARRRHPDEEDVTNWLCAIARLGIDIGPCLDGWLSDRSTGSIVQLAKFLLGAKSVVRGSGYWEKVSIEARRQIVDWLVSEAVETVMIESIDMVSDCDQWLFDSIDASVSLLKSERWR